MKSKEIWFFLQICRSSFDKKKIFFSQHEQVAQSFFTRNWERLQRFWRETISIFFQKSDSTDGGVNKRPNFWRRLFGCFGNIFSKRQPKNKIVYPRLDLPATDLDFEYNMSHESRGIALIFNHEFFTMANRSRRNGTDLDRDRLTEVLENFNFEVRVFNDLTYQQIQKQLEEGDTILFNLIMFLWDFYV